MLTTVSFKKMKEEYFLKIRKSFAVLLSLAMLLGVGVIAESKFKAGEYEKTVNGMNGPVSVKVTFTADSIEKIEVLDHMETPGIGDYAMEKVAEDIIEKQSLAVDSVTGATISSAVLKNAVKVCVEEAGGDVKALSEKFPKEPVEDIELTADVVIVGGGGAGLTAAVTALENGASVILIEKTGILGGNSLVVGGFYNAPDPARQDNKYQAERAPALDTMIEDALAEDPVNDEHKALQDAVREEFEAYKASDKTMFDSANWFALQTWNGGDKVAEIDMVKILAGNAEAGLHWLESLGQEFAENVHHGGGAMYPRSHQAVMPNGTGYISALRGQLKDSENYTEFTDTEGKSLIMDGDAVVGVNAVGKDGNKVTLYANKGVVLSTGGFAGNVELRQKYCEGDKWPDLGKNVGTTNLSGVTGDGIFMAEAAGANLVNMEQLQMLPYCNPKTGMLNDNLLQSGTSIFLNKEGKRFVREDGRRDEMSLAFMQQTDGLVYMVCRPTAEYEELRSLAGQSVPYLVENKVSGYIYAKDIADLALQLNLPEDVVREEIEYYNEYASEQKVDKFHRASYSMPLGEGPFISYERKTAAHHTMGGVEIDEHTHALRPDGSIVKGLYCAGEITGVVHGANRLGGNAIVDYLVFGRIAGEHAAKGE
jgi:urocanate reductase